MKEQHPAKWKEYQDARANKNNNPQAFKNFFKQSSLEAFYKKQSVYNGGKIFISISKPIVEVIIKDMLLQHEAIVGESEWTHSN